MPDASFNRWLAHALAAVSEGMCPNHLTPLRTTGWCVACQLWYRADFPARNVIAHYPIPVTRPAEP